MDLLDIMNRGAVAVQQADAADHLRCWADALIRAMLEYEDFGVVAASPQAERVLGAAMMLAPEVHGDSSGPTVVFDVNHASGTLLARAARRLRDRGNESRLVGLVLNPLLDAEVEINVAELDCVRVELKRSLSRQERECRVDRFAVLTG